MSKENVVAEVVLIPLKDLVVGENIRSFVPKERIEAMAESIKAHIAKGGRGLDKPLDVAKVNGKHEILDGQVRFLGAQHARVEALPCIVRKESDVGLFQIRSFLRTDPNAIEEALAYKENFKDMPMEQMVVASGKSEKDIRRRLILLELDENMQKAIRENVISAGHGVILAQVHNKKARKDLFKMIQSDKLSVQETASSIRSVLDMSSLKDVAFDTKDCKDCAHCHIDYPEMFDDGTEENMKGMCRNVPCLIKKQTAKLKDDVASMIKNGTKAFFFLKRRWDMEESELKELKGLLQLQDYAMYKKCGVCPRKVIAVFIDGEKYIYCPDKACHKAGDPKKGEKASAGKQEAVNKDPRKDKRVHETIFRYLRKAIADNISWETALTVILTEFIKASGMAPDEYLAEIDKVMSISEKDSKKIASSPWHYPIEDLLHRLAREKKEELVCNIVQGYFKTKAFYSLRSLEALGNTCEGKQTIKNFLVDEEYLKKLTKDGLHALGKEFKVELTESMKKTELVDKILAAKVQKGPKEIIDSKLSK